MGPQDDGTELGSQPGNKVKNKLELKEKKKNKPNPPTLNNNTGKLCKSPKLLTKDQQAAPVLDH